MILFKNTFTTLVLYGIVASPSNVATAQQILSCGATVASPTTLGADLLCNECTTGPAVTVNATLLDLNGFKVSCGANSTYETIRAIGTGSTITNGVVVNEGAVLTPWASWDCIKLEGADGHSVQDMTIGPCSSDGIDIDMVSNGCTITNNVITAVGDDGIDCNSNGNIITDNAIQNCGDDGIDLDGSNFNLVRNNDITNTGLEGIEVDGNNNVIELNVIQGSRYAIVIDEGVMNEVVQNEASQSDAPIDFLNNATETGCETNVFANNLGVENVDCSGGMQVGNIPGVTVSCGTTLTSITVLGGNLACDCLSGPAVTVDGTTFDLNGYTVSCGSSGNYQVIKAVGSAATIKNGAVFNAGSGTSSRDCIDLSGVDGHTVEDVIIGPCSSNGITITVGVNGCTIADNLIEGAGGDGISCSSDSNSITGNTIGDCGDDGIDLDKSSNNFVQMNEAYNVVNEGIEVDGDRNIINQNIVRGSGYAIVLEAGTRNEIMANEGSESSGGIDFLNKSTEARCAMNAFNYNNGVQQASCSPSI